MSENILAILGIESREDAITNLLAYSFNVNREFRVAFLKSVCGHETVATEQWKAYTRINLRDAGVPDLVLHGRDGATGRLIIIENKLKADEGEDQTVRYSTEGAVDLLLRRFGVEQHPTFVFLTLFPDQLPKAGDKWRTVTYRRLLDGLRAISLPADSVAAKLLCDWRELIDDFYKSATVGEDDVLLERLQNDRGLEGNFLYFISFVKQLNLPSDLVLEDWFRSSQSGRRYFGAVISKAEWHPEEMTPDSSGRWHLDPNKHFNIHIEPQFNVLAGVLNVYIHYEINPYKPERWLTANVSADERRAYDERRKQFVRNFSARKPHEIMIGGGYNQIGKTSCDFTRSTASAVWPKLGRLIEETSVSIDESLQALRT